MIGRNPSTGKIWSTKQSIAMIDDQPRHHAGSASLSAIRAGCRGLGHHCAFFALMRSCMGLPAEQKSINKTGGQFQSSP
ncbi:hypothetical protein, partial [Methylobacterium frigidaeris]|uniref:hypothetical protein n=1 Tax=Methylobacterium frigidaeris TaxID=2038277 RepID=UPI001A9CA10D